MSHLVPTPPYRTGRLRAKRAAALLWASFVFTATSLLAEPAREEARKFFEQAVYLTQDGEFAAAIPLYEEVIRMDPSILGAWESLGWAYWALDRQDDAVALWTRLQTIDERTPLPYNLLAKAAASEGEFDRAISLARKSLELQPDQPAIEHDLSRYLLWKGEVEESILRLHKTLEQDPNRFDIVLELARIYSTRNRFTEALPLWQRLSQHVPDNPDYLAMEALCLLHDNQPGPARERFERVLSRDSAHRVALEGMANLEEFGPQPARALSYLRDLIRATPEPYTQEAVRVRLINLLVRLHRLNPLEQTLGEPLDLVEDRLEYDPRSVDARLLRGELRLMDLKYVEAEEDFIQVLSEFNSYSIRARKGLFETYLAAKRFRKAREQWEHIREFNPLDPYLDYLLARLESTQGNFPAAFRALDRLEESGRRGAVAVILHHGLATSHYLPDAIPLDLFRDRLETLRAAGFHFVRSGDLPQMFAAFTSDAPESFTNHVILAASAPEPAQSAAQPSSYAPPPVPSARVQAATDRERRRRAPSAILSGRSVLPRRQGPEEEDTPDDAFTPGSAAPAPLPQQTRPVFRHPGIPMLVSINFDDGRRDVMQLATPVAREMNLVFSHHIPVGYILQEHPFILSWEQLSQYARTGLWEFGSHFLDAAILTPVTPSGKPTGRPLSNLIWRADQNRMETPEEYRVRIHREFEESRRLLRLNTGQSINFISYPFGDVGQEIETNLMNPSRAITETGQAYYEVGFVQSNFGFSISGDNPMLYQRHEMARWMSGSNVVEHLYASHPVYLARRLRAEFAALNGKQYRAMANVDWLEENGYPERMMEETRRYVRDRLSGGFVRPTRAAAATKSAWSLDSIKPRVRLGGESFRDNQGRSHRRWDLGAGLNLGERLAADGRIGSGRLRQSLPERVGPLSRNARSLRVNEESIGARATLLFVPDPGNPWTDLYPKYLSFGALQRDFSRDADGSILALEAETQLRPVLALDLMLRYERDLVPSALAAVEEILYDAMMVSATLRLRDWWELRASGAQYDFTDDNTRSHLRLGTHWLLHEASGLWLGLRYAYANSTKEREAYWTPYQLHRYMIEGQFRGSYRRNYYNLRGYVGVGRERVRPEAEAAFRELRDRARRQRWDAGEAPETDWEPIFGFSFSTRIRLLDHWELQGEAAYNETPSYNEFTLQGAITYFF